jgi:DNA-binding HxlR family transcriptional regulator
MARDVLAERLRRLVDFGILDTRPYEQTGRRTRYEYRLTEAGLDLYPVVLAMMQWGIATPGSPTGRRWCSATARAAS